MTVIGDRKAGRQPDWDIDLKLGQDGEMYVKGVSDALGAGHAEVKTDRLAPQTGNVFIEHACLYSTGWGPSGIATTKADLFAWVIADIVVAVPVWRVKKLHAWVIATKGEAECKVGSHPTKGVLVPIKSLLDVLLRSGDQHRPKGATTEVLCAECGKQADSCECPF